MAGFIDDFAMVIQDTQFNRKQTFDSETFGNGNKNVKWYTQPTGLFPYVSTILFLNFHTIAIFWRILCLDNQCLTCELLSLCFTQT